MEMHLSALKVVQSRRCSRCRRWGSLVTAAQGSPTAQTRSPPEIPPYPANLQPGCILVRKIIKECDLLFFKAAVVVSTWNLQA